MRTIFLVRHPEITDHASRRFYGWSDIGLSHRGICQTRMLIERLAGEDIRSIYSSDLYRAHYPASLVARSLNVSHISSGSFREIHFGDWEGLTYEEMEKTAPELCRTWLTLADDFRFPGGESIGEFHRRIRQCYDAAAGSSVQGNLAIITHGGVIRTLLCWILGIDISRMWEIHLDFGSVSSIRFDDGAAPPQVMAVNDVDYLR
ncbi:MAG: histidine phosphatase family protein [bacterium]